MKDKKDFGLYIQQKRKEKNLTQAELAEKLYVTESAVSKWERGVTYPDITLISDICLVLDINEHEFITSSNDNEYRMLKIKANRLNKINNVLFWIFSIMYAVAILTTFIVNLACNHTLSWFFIVLLSVITGFTFVPTISRFIKRNKLLYVTLSNLGSIILLLGVICIYTKGNWFLVATISLILAYVILFGPIFIHIYKLLNNKFFNFIKKNNCLISITLDMICLFVLLVICNLYTDTKNFWAFVAMMGILLSYVIIMGKAYLKKVTNLVNDKMKPYISFIYVTVCFIFLIILFLSVRTLNYDFLMGRAFMTGLYCYLTIIITMLLSKVITNKKIIGHS